MSSYKISARDIQFLSFEGGGGRGIAYLGALVAMLQPDFHVFRKHPVTGEQVLDMRQIKGISGASAGAITAVLLACNVSVEEIGKLALNQSPYTEDKELGSTSKVFASFNDMMHPRLSLDANVTMTPDISAPSGDFGFYWRNRDRDLARMQSIAEGAEKYARQILPASQPSTGVKLPLLLDNFFKDWGLAPGFKLRRHIAHLIAYYLTKHPPSGKEYKLWEKPRKFIELLGLTFEQHYQLTSGFELVLASVNMRYRQVFYLSRRMTPNLKIADAVRMSMSIPGFFKPVRITEAQVKKGRFNTNEQKILPGYWVDGGVGNNNPIHVFDLDENNRRVPNYQPGHLNPHLFPIRLGKELTTSDSLNPRLNEPREIAGPFPLFMSLLDTIIDNSSELQFFNARERGRALDLTTDLRNGKKLDTYDFDAKPETVGAILNQCVNETLAYFDLPQSKNPVTNKAMQTGFTPALIKGLDLLAAERKKAR